MAMMRMVGRRLKDILLTPTTNGGGGAAAAAAATPGTMLTRYFTTNSRSRAENLRKINPKVPPQEAASLAESLYYVIKQHEPLNITNTWNHVKDAGLSGLNSKTHMKLLLKWMRGRNMLKQFCHQFGSNKKFLLCTLPEDPQIKQYENSIDQKIKSKKPPAKSKKAKAKKALLKRTKLRS